ncbi:MAG: hypothetical protein ABFS10_14225 [Bacteroidota bacterium]
MRILNTITLSAISVLLIILAACNEDPEELNQLVNGVDMEELVSVHLPGYELVRSRLMFDWGREYVYQSNDEAKNLHMKVGVYPSVEKAEEAAGAYAMLCSAVFYPGPYDSYMVGDRCWSPYFHGENQEIMAIVFIRKNMLINISSGDGFGEVGTLAKAIDEGILDRDDYIDLAHELQLPVIDSITATKSVLREGESTTVTVYASDPGNQSIEYDVIGMTKLDTEEGNSFREHATVDFMGANLTGTHSYNFLVMNEANVYSEMATFQLTVLE